MMAAGKARQQRGRQQVPPAKLAARAQQQQQQLVTMYSTSVAEALEYMTAMTRVLLVGSVPIQVLFHSGYTQIGLDVR